MSLDNIIQDNEFFEKGADLAKHYLYAYADQKGNATLMLREKQFSENTSGISPRKITAFKINILLPYQNENFLEQYINTLTEYKRGIIQNKTSIINTLKKEKDFSESLSALSSSLGKYFPRMLGTIANTASILTFRGKASQEWHYSLEDIESEIKAHNFSSWILDYSTKFIDELLEKEFFDENRKPQYEEISSKFKDIAWHHRDSISRLSNRRDEIIFQYETLFGKFKIDEIY